MRAPVVFLSLLPKAFLLRSAKFFSAKVEIKRHVLPLRVELPALGADAIPAACGLSFVGVGAFESVLMPFFGRVEQGVVPVVLKGINCPKLASLARSQKRGNPGLVARVRYRYNPRYACLFALDFNRLDVGFAEVRAKAMHLD